MRALFSLVLVVSACKRDKPSHDDPPQRPIVHKEPEEQPDPMREEYIADVMAFSHTDHDTVRARMKLGSAPLKQEWEKWEKEAPMTEPRIKEFYKQTSNYIYELGEWHISDPMKRVGDAQLVDGLVKRKPKN